MVHFSSGSDALLLDEDNAILKYGHQFADYLGKGMGDNWSQVAFSLIHEVISSIHKVFLQL